MELIKNRLLTISTGILLLFTVWVFIFTESAYETIETTSLWVRNYFGYFYLYLGLACVVLLLAVALSPYGKIRLGKENSRPEHSLWAWSAMLYSAGMGAGILLRAVQEPVYMQQNPPYSSQLPADILALEFTFYQWGFTAWAFYGLFAVVVGYALFRQNRKVRISSAVFENRASKKLRASIDIVTIVTTVFGLIAAIGLGTTQIKGGLDHIFKASLGLSATLLLTFLVSAIAFYSAWQGLNKGIKVISKINICLVSAENSIPKTYVFLITFHVEHS